MLVPKLNIGSESFMIIMRSLIAVLVVDGPPHLTCDVACFRATPRLLVELSKNAVIFGVKIPCLSWQLIVLSLGEAGI